MLKLSLEEKLKTLKELNAEIIELVPEDDLEAEIQQADECHEKIFEALARIDHALTPVSTSPATAVDRGKEEPARTHSSAPKVKLPKLSLLPRFNGDLMKWSTFWDSYESAIHKNDDLTDVDKFNYLRSLLERTALDTISGLTLSATNYKEAIELLQKRFGNKPLIISKHMETLLNVESVASDQSLRELRHLYDTTESHLRSLKSLGVESSSYGAMLSPMLLMKLPPELRLIVSRETTDTELDMDSLLKVFKQELEARERASVPKTTKPHSQSSRSQDRGRGQDRGRHQSSAL